MGDKRTLRFYLLSTPLPLWTSIITLQKTLVLKIIWLYNVLDNGLVLQIKTDCNQKSQLRADEETPEWMKHVLGNSTHFNLIENGFRFCHSNFGTCCKTGALPVQNQRCKQTDYQAYELGECGKFDFDFKRIKGGFVTLNGPDSGFKSLFYRDGYEFINLRSVQDAWAPEWVRLVLGNGEVLKCSFDEKMVCKPEGKISFVLGILICTAFSLYFSFSANGLALNKATENITTQISIESSDYGKLELISFM